MARPKSNPTSPDGKGPNKSEAIREVLAQNPKAQSKEIIDILAQRGIRIQPSLIYMVRSKQRQQKRRQKRERAVESSARTGVANPVALIMKVKALASEAGSIKNLKQLVDVLAE